MRKVRWWREGTKVEGFLRGSLSRAPELGPWLEMEVAPGGGAEFKVVGEVGESIEKAS